MTIHGVQNCSATGNSFEAYLNRTVLITSSV